MQYRQATRLSAPHYVDALMAWIERQIKDPAIFPPEHLAGTLVQA
jgi:hypothetical protein